MKILIISGRAEKHPLRRTSRRESSKGTHHHGKPIAAKPKALSNPDDNDATYYQEGQEVEYHTAP